MDEYRPNHEENLEDLILYIDSQEYSDFRECPDHALAVLQFAERFEIQDLWTDAFVHCAGMYNDLTSSGEYEVSRSIFPNLLPSKPAWLTFPSQSPERHKP